MCHNCVSPVCQLCVNCVPTVTVCHLCVTCVRQTLESVLLPGETLLAASDAAIDKSLKKKTLAFKWEDPPGWARGKVVQYTPTAKTQNVNVKYQDGSKYPHMLTMMKYADRDEAAYGSWAIIAADTPVTG